MPLKLIRQDITKMTCDAIVNAANRSLLGGGGVDGAIHRAAGKRLLKACEKLGGCETGDAKLTKGYDLPCRYVIHTVGPVWHGGTSGERELLISCYRKSLALAVRKRCKSIAFPLISAGAYGYPKDEALQVATDTITAFLAEQKQDLLVYLVIFNSTAYTISKERFADIEAFISDQYAAEAEQQSRLRNIEQEWHQEEKLFPSASVNYSAAMPLPENEKKKPKLSGRRRDKQKAVQPYEEYSIGSSFDVNDELSAMLNQIDESFSQMLMRKIDESGMTDAACYKKANIDRKLFSKIRSDIHYRPKKVTALAFAIALELNLEETKELLMKAGYALSHSSKFDLIVEYFITKGIYNVFTINEALFAFDQVLIGA